MNARAQRRLAVLALSIVALSGCDLSLTAPPYQPPAAAQTVEVVVTPGEAAVLVGSTVEFAAQVTGTANTAVTWSVSGTACGSVTAAGLYTAPAAATTCVVTAASVASPSATGSAIVTVTATPPPVAVALSPATSTVSACKTQAFTATVTGTTNKAVTWTVQEAGGGTVSSTGVYTAPADAGTYHVVATSAADGTKKATATVTVRDQIVAVAVSPGTVQLAPGQTAQLSATVTTSCGTFASVRTLHADGTLE